MGKINEYFDNVYCLNLASQPERMKTMEKRFRFAGIEFERFNAISGEVARHFFRTMEENSNSEFNTFSNAFANENYLACAMSHLSIYSTAIARGEKNILIVEDDVRIHRNANELFEQQLESMTGIMNRGQSEPPPRLLYLSYIPLSDDQSRWDYNVTDAGREQFTPNIFRAKNLWSLMAYGIDSRLMRKMLQVYGTDFPCEIDRYFVDFIQKHETYCFGVSPQLFCAEDGQSDNSGVFETKMIERSVDTRYAKHTDYV